MQMQEFVVGAERELASNLSVSARWVHKWLVRAIDDTGSAGRGPERDLHHRQPGRGPSRRSRTPSPTAAARSPCPSRKRDYDGVELALNKRMSNNWSGRVSYLWSRLYGNYSGLSQTDENGRQSPNVGRLYDYPVMMFDQTGAARVRPSRHRPHAPVQGPVPLRLQVRAERGPQLVRRLGPPALARDGLHHARTTSRCNYLGRNSDGRMPFYSQADLYAQYRLTLGGRKAVTLQRQRDQPVRPGRRRTTTTRPRATTPPSTAHRTTSTEASSTSSSWRRRRASPRTHAS